MTFLMCQTQNPAQSPPIIIRPKKSRGDTSRKAEIASKIPAIPTIKTIAVSIPAKLGSDSLLEYLIPPPFKFLSF